MFASAPTAGANDPAPGRNGLHPSCDRPVRLPPSVIDVEASGFGADSYPIEIGGVTAQGLRYNFLIQPMEDWTHWSEDAERLHGISRERLMNEGLPALEVCLRLNSLLGKSTVYSDGWNFDQSWIARLFDAARCRQSFQVQALQRLFEDGDYDIWDATLKSCWGNEVLLPRHRASSDATLVRRAFVLLQARHRARMAA
jgi:hypothetical protein